MCQKGWTSPDPAARDRPPDHPAAARRQPVSWDTALSFVASRLAALRAAHGPESVAVFGGGGLTNEKAYALGKFARTVLATPNIDYNGRFCMASAAAGANRTLGLDRGLPFPLADLGGAQAVLLLGSNLAETMPPSVQHLAGVRAAGGLIVVDPRRSATADLTADDGGRARAARARHRPRAAAGPRAHRAGRGLRRPRLPRRADHGSRRRPPLAGALVARADRAGHRRPGRDPAARRVPAGQRLAVARRSRRVRPHRSRRRAEHAGHRHRHRGDHARAAARPARAGSAPATARSPARATGRAVASTGRRPTSCPATGPSRTRRRARTSRGCGASTPPTCRAPGCPPIAAAAVARHARTARGRCSCTGRTCWSAPRTPTACGERLASLDLLVVCDFLPSETALLADVVLPVTQWAEEEGTMTSLEGRVIRRRRVLAAAARGAQRARDPRRPRPAARVARSGSTPSPAVVFDELARASAGGRADYSGLSHARLDAEPDLFWPVPAGPTPHPGTPRHVPRPLPDARRSRPPDPRRPPRPVRRPAPRRARCS